MSELKVNEEQVRKEHQKEVNQAAHWAYALGLIVVSFMLMLGFIAILGD